jgi:hypothetical protein
MKRLSLLIAIALISVIGLGSQAYATNVTFQVNMSVQQALGNFTPGTNQVVVRGTFNNWSGVANECTDGDADGIYTGTFDLTAGAIEYKFVIIGGASDVWEGIANNRTATVGADPLVLPVVYFSDVVSSNTADVEVLFRVDMRVQILNGNFDENTDWIVVRGNHANIGNWGGATRLNLEAGNPGVYSAFIQFSDLPVNAPIEYKFVILAAGDPNAASWESSANRSFTPTGTEPDEEPVGGNGFGEIYPPLVFFANISFADIISHDLQVIFQVEDTPLRGRIAAEGFIVDVQSGDTVRTVNDLDAAGYFNNWPWGNFAAEHIMNDAGTDGDLTAGDHVWSKQILFAAGSPRLLVYKYGANNLDVEAGFARNHERTLDDAGNEYRMDIDCWGSPDTLFHNWACVISAADDHTLPAPNAFALEQNYPNPFNPSTAITFTMNYRDFARLTVFDVNGRTVQSTNFGVLEAGRHTVGFSGSNFATGVYFYRLETPSFSQTRKMLLLK